MVTPLETNVGASGVFSDASVGSRSQVTALRLSLDQRKRSIEASRHRALRSGDRAAADRHQAAFLTLLHSTQVSSLLLPFR